MRNGYQKEIDTAIRRAEIAERKTAEKEAVIERQKNRIDELDHKANPQRYRLSSGAELIGHRFLGNNPYTVTLKIWTKIKDIEHTAVTYLSDSDKRLHAFSNGELTEHEFINACFSAAEQVSEIQANLLGAAIELAAGGSAQPYVGTGGGGSTSELPWRDKDNDKNNNIKTTYGKKRRQDNERDLCEAILQNFLCSAKNATIRSLLCYETNRKIRAKWKIDNQ